MKPTTAKLQAHSSSSEWAQLCHLHNDAGLSAIDERFGSDSLICTSNYLLCYLWDLIDVHAGSMSSTSTSHASPFRMDTDFQTYVESQTMMGTLVTL